MDTLNFNDADLKANREGRLSDAQQKRLDADLTMIHRHNRYVLAGCCVIMFAVVAILWVLNGGEAKVIGCFIVTTMLVVMAVVVGVIHWWSMRGLNNGIISTVEGTAEIIITFTTVKGMRVPFNCLWLSRSWLSHFAFYFQDKESLRYFKNGTRYRVYYLPYANPQALSAEEIEPEKARA